MGVSAGAVGGGAAGRGEDVGVNARLAVQERKGTGWSAATAASMRAQLVNVEQSVAAGQRRRPGAGVQPLSA